MEPDSLQELLKIQRDILAELRRAHTVKAEPIREILTLEEAADYLRWSPATIREKMRDQMIPYYRIEGKTIRFRRSKLDAWINTGEIIDREESRESA